MTIADLLFQMPAVPGWEERLQVTFLAPAEPSDPNMPVAVAADQASRTRANIVVSRTPTEATDPNAECEKFIAQTAKLVPGLELVGDITPFDFDDRVPGVITAVSFPATQQVRLTQLHAFRIDDGVLTQLVATVDEVEGEQKREGMRRMLLSFSPNLAAQS
jgi:hypothetical protein